MSRCTDSKTVGILVDYEADVNHRNKAGKTALHASAADATLTEVTEELLRRGADPNIADEDGCTPLHVASRMKNEAAIDILCDRDADVNAFDKDGNTPLLVALDKDFESVAIKFMDKGADVKASNRNGLVNTFAVKDFLK